uniref:Uncharacterized protein n=1 Tax=Aureoumbra lagunensis TaxID=44058 RepID=A0A7S3JR67_9STRA|mmetsp:Transcript_3964/g.5572  ORF Transcript_3964/g.5572 Transcript_3964/m.5572 type:complete len:177 (-) Transcript_3964:186-716(-)
MGCARSKLEEDGQKETQALSVDEEFFKLEVDKGHMNERRRSFVQRLYENLAKDGELNAEAMGKAFDADSHPDVVNGNRTAEDVRNELIEMLSMNGGVVSMQLFEDYYDIQSITIESDPQFEALVRSSWVPFLRKLTLARRSGGGRGAPPYSANKITGASTNTSPPPREAPALPHTK